MKPTFTLGIEEEYQTVDPETRDLRSHIHAEIIEKGKLVLQERVKTEMHQSVVEVGTSVCSNIKEAREELKSLRRHMIRLWLTMDERRPLAEGFPPQNGYGDRQLIETALLATG